MRGTTIDEDIGNQRIDLLFSRTRFILFYLAILYPLFFILDWHERPWDRPFALFARLSATAVMFALFLLSRSQWGRPRALFVASISFLVAQAGFAAIVWHAKGFGSSNGDAFELVFGTFCVLIPATTSWAGMVGLGMAGIQWATYALSSSPVRYSDAIWNIIPFFIIFLTGRHVANLIEVAWRKEFVGRASLEEAIKQLRATQDKLVQSEKMAALGRLTAGVGHELNNPLFVIGANLSVIQDAVNTLGTSSDLQPVSQSLTGALQRLRSALSRASIVSEILRQFSTPPNPRMEATDLNSVVEMSIALVTMTARRKEISIHRDFGSLPSFDCDSQSLSQVFVNLLENACDAVENNGNIYVSTRANGESSIEVRVKDDGSGIPAENLDKLSEPFFTTKPPGKGMGLGLTVASNVVERYGGSLSFSNCNPGAVAIVILPLKSRTS